VKSGFSVVSSWVRGISEKPDAADDEFEEIVTQRSGTSEDSVKEILGDQVFNYPKPPSLFRELLRFATDRDDIVLDFFAGSGTTAHAVLQLNAEDGGNRRFILVSSTEATAEEPDKNLCRDVCAERVRRVIDGYGKVAGLGGEFAYLRAIRLTQGELPWELTPELAWRTLCLRHGGGIADMPTEPVASLPNGDGDAQIFFCPSTGEKTLALLAERLSGPAIIYSDRPGTIRDAFPSHCALEIRDIQDAVETAAVPPEDDE
jgi:adenine-specific DNA-methyltransferase